MADRRKRRVKTCKKEALKKQANMKSQKAKTTPVPFFTRRNACTCVRQVPTRRNAAN
jgi:hypothetical protein